MLKNIIVAVLSVLSFSVPSFARSFNLDSVRADGLPAIEVPAVNGAAAATVPATPKEWTIIYYSTTKDKLRLSFLSQLLQMKMNGSTDKVNVLLEGSFPMQMDDGSISTPTVRLALGRPWTMEFLEQQLAPAIADDGTIKEAFIPAMAEDLISRENNVDTGDWRRAAAFAKWAKANYPARRYAFVMFGHGNGFFDPKKTNAKNTLLDTDTRNYVTVPEMRLLMAEAGRVDILVMQSCLMQMAETVWQVRDYTEAVVGSSELMWSTGYDFPGMIKLLTADPGITVPDLGAWLANGYVERVKTGKKSGHASVIPTAALPGFAVKVDAWVDAVMALKDRRLLYPAIEKVARFDIFGVTAGDPATAESPAIVAQAAKVSLSGDIYDFVRLVNESLTDGSAESEAARARGTDLMNYISGTLVTSYFSHGKSAAGSDFSLARGISAHLPQQQYLALPEARNKSRGGLETPYWDIPFVKETKWGAFLHWLYKHNVEAR